MSFPDIIFGKCEVCGGGGGDAPAPSSADAPATDTVGNGMPLKEYDGKMMCKICIQEAKAKEESKLDTERRSEEERFRQSAGFVNSV